MGLENYFFQLADQIWQILLNDVSNNIELD